MSESGLHPLETILRLCAAAAPEPWYPRVFVKQAGVDPQALGRCLEELWLSGLIERTPGNDETGPAISLTREGQRVLLDPECLERLRSGQPVSSTDRGAIIRQALRGRLRPVVTVALVLLNVLVFAWGYSKAREKHLDSDFLRGNVEVGQGVEKAKALYQIQEKSGAITAAALIEGQWWRLLTAGFVHIGFLHLLMNMVFLYLAGRFLELMWGPIRYLVIYLAAVLGGCCLSVVHHVGLSAGASGGVCGLLAAEAVWFLFNRRYLPRVLLRQARTAFFVNLVLLVFISSFNGVGGWGHFGGAATGAMTAMLLQLHRFGPPPWRWLALAGFAPMFWYGHFVIEQAQLTNKDWQKVEDNLFETRFAPAIRRAVQKARVAYADTVEPVLEIHPERRDAAKVEAALAVLSEQQGKLNAVAEQLARAGPYGSPEAEDARRVGGDYVRSVAEWFAEAERILRIGVKRTDKDRQALRQQQQKVEDARARWKDLFQGKGRDAL
jgi:membrane associated rhomboid family serine protease